MQKVAILIIITFLISGCSTLRRQSRVVPEGEPSLEVSLNNIMQKNLTKYNFNVQKAEIQYIEEGRNINMIASLKYRSDGKYLVSVRSITGIEIARIFISKDTILVNDRINKKLYYGSTDYLEEKYGITAGAIPLLFGDLIIDTDGEIIVKCTGEKSEIKRSINSKDIYYKIDCTKKKVSEIKVEGFNGEGGIEIKLRNFKNLDGRTFPEIIEMSERENKSEIRIRIKKIEFEDEEGIKFIPGANYEKILIR